MTALSMTGFGRAIYNGDSFVLRVELRSINHRFLEIGVRLPRSMSQLEDRLRREIGSRLNRGKVDVSVHLENSAPGAARVRLDTSVADGYREALRELASRFGIPGRLRLEHLVHLPDLFVLEQDEQDEEALWQGLSSALGEALEALTAMRRAEGEKLVADILDRISEIARHVETIEERAPQVPEAYRQQLQKRLAEVLGAPGLDEARLAQEVAIFADRCSIDEELVRLRSHLDQLRNTLTGEGVLGRKADFILQEINREANTVGAKANDLAITQAVIEIKTVLEKIREQVQNLE